MPNPSYEITAQADGHAEAIQITFNPQDISYRGSCSSSSPSTILLP
jgi:peptide methionine sulfoxide reductase MsrA